MNPKPMTYQSHSENTLPSQILDETVKVLHCYKLRPRPTPPAEYVEYRKMPDGEAKRNLKNNRDFWSQDSVKNYLDAMESLESQHTSNIFHLEWCLQQNPTAEQRYKFESTLEELKTECYWDYGKGAVLAAPGGVDVNWQ